MLLSLVDAYYVVCKVKRGPSEFSPPKGLQMDQPQITPRLALLEEALTILFCRVDDIYYRLNPKVVCYQTFKELSDSEVITLALF